jgi:ActR/RegA family two-component response regulator
MKVLTFLYRCTLQRRLAEALSASQFDVETAASAKECLQFAQVTRYEGILVDTDSLDFGDVVTLIKLLRHANCNTALFVFAGYLNLQQRLHCLKQEWMTTCVSHSLARR